MFSLSYYSQTQTMSQDDTGVWLQENLPHLSAKTGPVPSANLLVLISTQFDLRVKDKEQASQYWLQSANTNPYGPCRPGQPAHNEFTCEEILP